ncbi:MAG TPA: tail fiber domain-containing protein [Planctomycetota bacterium]|nr:tail fiber domain-containing protein [Planctomycetota bacterium]
MTRSGRRPRIAPCLSLALAAALAASSARAGDVSVKLDSGTGFSVKNAAGAIERLRVDEATGNVSRNGALFVHTTGTNNLYVGPGAGNPAVTPSQLNTAFGINALAVATGSYNTAVGANALSVNTVGWRNTAFGQDALRSNTLGRWNTALGTRTLELNTTGYENTAVGVHSLTINTTGAQNVALGSAALGQNTSGSLNVAIGQWAGQNQTTGSNNIYIANDGGAGENGQIRIGRSGIHTQAHIAGIFGATSSGGSPVLVNSSGTLGTTTSSARFKRDVEEMGDASDLLLRLRPVRFHYLEEVVGADEAGTEQYGLIAEEVAKVAPELVVAGSDGKPYSVKYHVLPSLLLNEMQKQQRVIAALSARIAALEAAPGAACEAGAR